MSNRTRWSVFCGIMVIFMITIFGTSATAEVVSRGGDHYVQAGAEWRLRTRPNDPDAWVRVDIQRIVVQVSPGRNIGELQREGVASPASLGPALPGGYRALGVPAHMDPFRYLDQLERSPVIRSARFDAIADYYFTPNDPLFPNQWGMSEAVTALPSAWNVSTGGGVLVGILDSGVDTGHPDLVGRIDGASSEFGPVDDVVGHGTAVCGIVGAKSNNGQGVAGVAGGTGNGGAQLLVMACGSTPTESEIAAGITFAADHGAKVLNISLGFCTGDDTTYPDIADAITYATNASHDVVIVCASGNADPGCRQQFTAYPAKNSNCIAVRAIEADGTEFGLYGPGNEVDLLAPGGDGIWTTDLLGGAGYSLTDYTCESGPSSCFGGTSAAAPFVTGVVALMRSVNPALTRTQIYNILIYSADKLASMNGANYTPQEGYGRVNALGAVVGAAFDAQVLRGLYTTSQTWPDASKPFHNLYLPADVEVAAGATVNITPKTDISGGMTVYFSTSDAGDLEPFFTDKVELIAKGMLNVNGTSSRRVALRSGSYSPTENDWAHVYALEGGNLVLTNADIKNSQNGVIANTNGTISVSNCTFSSNATTDAKFGGSPSSCSVTNSTFTVGGGTGVEIDNGTVTLSGNTFSGLSAGATAIKCDAPGAVCTVSSNTITGSSGATGVWLGNGTGTLTGNTISGCTKGIYLTGGPHTIGTTQAHTGNTLANNAYGIYASCLGAGTCPSGCPTTFATIRRNTFTSDSTAVYSVKTAGLDLGTASTDGKNILTGSGACVVNNTSSCGTIQARGNYWGSCAAPTNLCGSVDVTGWLCNPPGGTRLMAGGGEDGARTSTGVFAIRGVMPNPTSGAADFLFHLPEAVGDVSLSFYDPAGRLVRVIHGGDLTAGDHQLHWDGRDKEGRSASEGLYFARLRAGRQDATAKILVRTSR